MKGAALTSLVPSGREPEGQFDEAAIVGKTGAEIQDRHDISAPFGAQGRLPMVSQNRKYCGWHIRLLGLGACDPEGTANLPCQTQRLTRISAPAEGRRPMRACGAVVPGVSATECETWMGRVYRMRTLKSCLSWLSLLNGLEGGRGQCISDRGFFRRDSRAANARHRFESGMPRPSL
jgi:hypothetical protein